MRGYKKILVLLGTGAVTAVNAAAQPTMHWQRFLGGSGRERANAVCVTHGGTIVVAGSSRSTDGDVLDHHGDRNHTDAWIVALDTTGAVQWRRSLGGSSFDEGNAIVALDDGGVIAAGVSRSTDGDFSGHHGDESSTDAWIARLDARGTLVWARSVGGSEYDAIDALAATPDGGAIAAGSSNSNDGDVAGHHGTADFSDAWIVRIAPTGEIMWQRSLGGSDNDEAHAIVAARNGDFLVAGVTSSTDGDITGAHGGDDVWAARISATGDLRWSRTMGGSGNDGANAIAELPDGRVFVAGYSYSNDGDVTDHVGSDTWRDAMVAAFDSTGHLLAAHSFGGSRDDLVRGVTLVDTTVVVAGSTESSDGLVAGHHGATTSDGWLVGFDRAVAQRWQLCVGSSDRESFNAVAPLASGWVVVGSAHGVAPPIHGDDDVWVARFVLSAAPDPPTHSMAERN